jgi:hypothetical protein
MLVVLAVNDLNVEHVPEPFVRVGLNDGDSIFASKSRRAGVNCAV